MRDTSEYRWMLQNGAWRSSARKLERQFWQGSGAKEAAPGHAEAPSRCDYLLALVTLVRLPNTISVKTSGDT